MLLGSSPCLVTRKKDTAVVSFFLVEARGVEPLSEDVATTLSTSVVACRFYREVAKRLATLTASLIVFFRRPQAETDRRIPLNWAPVLSTWAMLGRSLASQFLRLLLIVVVGCQLIGFCVLTWTTPRLAYAAQTIPVESRNAPG